MKVKIDEDFQRKKEEILNHVEGLIKKDGIDGLSMRKLAKDMQMTPGIFYHYFQNKEEVLASVVMRGYQDILTIIQDSINPALSVEEQLYKTFDSYLHGMLERKELYQILMNSRYPIIAEQTSILTRGLAKNRKSLQFLCAAIDRGIQQGIFACEDVEASAQCIWCSMYGLLDRLIKEDVDMEQRERLIQTQLTMQLNAIRR